MGVIHYIEESTTYYVYKNPSSDEVHKRYRYWLSIFNSFISYWNISSEEVDVSIGLFAELIVRIDKRREYFKIYHDKMQVNEIKETALVAYWIIKMKPFQALNMQAERINERFAQFIIMGTLQSIYEAYGKKLDVSKDYSKRLQYAFDYWDISKEAMMMIAESLCPFLVEEKEND